MATKLEKFFKFFKKMSNLKLIALGFLVVILIGSFLLVHPIFLKDGIRINYIDALYTSTSATCVTGLIAVDCGDTFNLAGQIVIMILIQIGGLGVLTLGTGLLYLIKRKVSLKERNLIIDSLNFNNASDLLPIFRKVFIYTFLIETLGAGLSLITFSKKYEIGDAIFKSIFHSIASFNNSGFDIFGGGTNMIIYQNDVLLNFVTMGLVVLGGLGFIVINDVLTHPFKFKKCSLHSKIVLLMTGTLIVSGMLLIRLTEINNKEFTWLGALFMSVSTRTAGFSTFAVSSFQQSTKFIIIILMFIGASPCSTGGGIKTTTLFVLIKSTLSMITHKPAKAFKRSISDETIKKSLAVTMLALFILLFGTLLVSFIENITGNNAKYTFIDYLLEITSAYGTVGLSVGMTPHLTIWSKLICIIIMYVGRIGPITFFSLWYSGEGDSFRYPEGVITVG